MPYIISLCDICYIAAIKDSTNSLGDFRFKGCMSIQAEPLFYKSKSKQIHLIQTSLNREAVGCSFPVCRAVLHNLVLWAKIAAIVFIINIGVFIEDAVSRHGRPIFHAKNLPVIFYVVAWSCMYCNRDFF